MLYKMMKMECVWLCEGGLGVLATNVMLHTWNEKTKKSHDARRGVTTEWKCVGPGTVASFRKRPGYALRTDIHRSR